MSDDEIDAAPVGADDSFSDDSSAPEDENVPLVNNANPANDEQPGQQNNLDELVRDLTAEEMDKLVQLQDMIGNEDLGICRALLESKGWDLEATAREQLGLPPSNANNGNNAEEGGGGVRRREQQINPQRPPPLIPVAHNARITRRPRPVEGWLSWTVDWGYYILTLPVILPLRLTFGLIHGVYGFFSSLLGLPALDGPRAGRAINPEADVRAFRDHFESLHGQNHPPFHPGSYSQVLDEAKKELKFLLVYLHSPDHQDTSSFCQNVLLSPEFCEFLANNSMLFWGCSVQTAEGYRVSQALRENTYPFLAVIVLRQNRMMMVGRIEGLIDRAVLVERLELIMRDNEAFIVATRVEREERERNQSIRQEQDAAFQETLRQDQEKERKKQEELERKRQEEEEQLRLEREEREKKDKIRQMKIDLVTDIPDEPEPDHPEVVRILIKLPGGQRLERRFLRTQSMKFLYLFVFCHPDSPDEFDITTNFPKKVLRCKPEDEPPTFEEAGLGQSTMLFVHDLEA